MAKESQLPEDFVTGYWEVVVGELVEKGFSRPDAEIAAQGYRGYMKCAGDTIYNDKTTESARMAKNWFDRHVKPLRAKKPRNAAPKPVPAARRTTRRKNPPAA